MFATRNKCIATSNKCLTSSNKKLLELEASSCQERSRSKRSPKERFSSKEVRG